MPKDRDQQTPEEPEDEARLEATRGQGRAGTGGDVLPDERSAPGAASGGEVTDARRTMPADQEGKYR